jgi:hypothetical protein
MPELTKTLLLSNEMKHINKIETKRDNSYREFRLHSTGSVTQ